MAIFNFLKVCTCGHVRAQHTNNTGACAEPFGKCKCPAFAELCSVCKHPVSTHNQAGTGFCTRIRRRYPYRSMCLCKNYQVSGS